MYHSVHHGTKFGPPRLLDSFSIAVAFSLLLRHVYVQLNLALALLCAYIGKWQSL